MMKKYRLFEKPPLTKDREKIQRFTEVSGKGQKNRKKKYI